MKVAFYYHIPLAPKEDGLYVPSYLGVFLDEIARNVELLCLVMHQAKGRQIDEADYKLENTNIEFINLGVKTAVWKRSLNPGKILKSKLKQIEKCQAFLIRAPTPLSPYFHKYIINPKLFYLVVGDYKEGAKQLGTKGLKNKLLYAYFIHNDKKFRQRLPETDVLVNSPQLYEKYKDQSKSIQLIKTTTLRADDFYDKPFAELREPIKLLFTGRIEPAKGLFELLNSVQQLIKSGLKIQLDIVGWENNPLKPFENNLVAHAKKLTIEDCIIFHGKRKIGQELNAFYRNADIYVLPTHYEGFPRTIWEAMANNLPVVTTNVGAIPYYLKDKKNAYIVPPKNIELLTEAIKLCIENNELRAKIIKNGYDLAKDSSLSIQTAKLIKYIKEKL